MGCCGHAGLVDPGSIPGGAREVIFRRMLLLLEGSFRAAEQPLERKDKK